MRTEDDFYIMKRLIIGLASIKLQEKRVIKLWWVCTFTVQKIFIIGKTKALP
jgi:hypothetical protein